MNIAFSRSANEWNEFPAFVQQHMQEYDALKICDVGGGANPILPLEFVETHHLDYTLLDISSAELAKAPKGYKRLVQDIEAESFILTNEFDFVITKMMAEHVRNGWLFHKNIFRMLKPGGRTVHYFPTLYAFPFLVNKLVPDWLSSFLLDIFLPRNKYQLGKFPAYYSWCYGPVSAMLQMLTEIGYEIVLYRGFFGHTYYSRIPMLRSLHREYTEYLVKHPNPYLTSFAQLVLRKPESVPVLKPCFCCDSGN